MRVNIINWRRVALTVKVIIINDEKLVYSIMSQSMVHYLCCASFSSAVVVEIIFELVQVVVVIFIILSVLWLIKLIHVY